MRGEQAIFNLEIKKMSGSSLSPDLHPALFVWEYFSHIFISQVKFAKNIRNDFKHFILFDKR